MRVLRFGALVVVLTGLLSACAAAASPGMGHVNAQDHGLSQQLSFDRTGRTYPVLTLDVTSEFRDSTGARIVSLSDDGVDEPERHITGALSNGEPVEIVVFLGTSWTPSVGDLEKLTKGEHTSMSENLTPVIAYASTPTSITIALRPAKESDRYSIAVNGQTSSGSAPEFTIFDLEPDAAYDVQVTADSPGYMYKLSIRTLK